MRLRRATLNIRDRAHQFVIELAAVERSQVIQLPQRLLRSILSRIRAELGDDDALSGHLQGQRGEDVLDIILFGEDELSVRLAQIDLSRF